MPEEHSTGYTSPQEEKPEPKCAFNPRTGWHIPIAEFERRLARTREMNKLAQRRCRKGKADQSAAEELAATTDAAALLADLDTTDARVTLEEMTAEKRAFVAWLKEDGPRQRQHRGKAKLYVAGRVLLLGMRREMGEPAPAEFARRLASAINEPVNRHRGMSVLKALTRLEGEGGPWSSCHDRERVTLAGDA